MTYTTNTDGRSAEMILKHCILTLQERGKERDTSEGERSMGKTIRLFNTLYGLTLTEEQGWLFMVLLKLVRASTGKPNIDNYVDGAAYFALAGETALKDAGELK